MLDRLLGRRGAYHPNVFRAPSGMTETLFYRASLRLPQPALPAARGHATPMSLPISTANGGTLVLSRDANGNARYSVILNPVPQDM